MYYRKINGPEGVELRLIDAIYDERMRDFMNLMHPLALTIKRRHPNSGYQEFGSLADISFRFANMEDFAYAVTTMARPEFRLISPEAAQQIIQARFSEDAHRLMEADAKLPNISEEDVERDQRAFGLHS